MEELRSIANSHSISLWSAATDFARSGVLHSRTGGALEDFLAFVQGLSQRAKTMAVTDIAVLCVHETGLMDWRTREGGERARMRKENLEEFLVACQQFSERRKKAMFNLNQSEQHGMEELGEFLNEVTLQSSDRDTATSPSVNLMTLHSAKGLEFPLVFIVGLEQGLMPIQGSGSVDLEEERRLMYVGVTRCMRTLYLTHAATRSRFGKRPQLQAPSGYLRELPQELLVHMRRAHGGSSSFPRFGRRSSSVHEARRDTPPNQSRPPPGRSRGSSREYRSSSVRFGQRVRHASYGDGVVTAIHGDGPRMRLEINFVNSGKKWLMANNAHLRFLE